MDVAMHFVGVNGRTYTPGEVIEGLSDAQRERLLKKQAIRCTFRENAKAPENSQNPVGEPSEAAPHGEPALPEADEAEDEQALEDTDETLTIDASDSIVDKPMEQKTATAKRGASRTKTGGTK